MSEKKINSNTETEKQIGKTDDELKTETETVNAIAHKLRELLGKDIKTETVNAMARKLVKLLGKDIKLDKMMELEIELKEPNMIELEIEFNAPHKKKVGVRIKKQGIIRKRKKP